MTTLHILKLRITELRGNCQRTTQIRDKQYFLDTPLILPTTLKEAQQTLTSAQQEYQKLYRTLLANSQAHDDKGVDAYVAAHPEVETEAAKKMYYNTKKVRTTMMTVLTKKKNSNVFNHIKVPVYHG